MPHPETGTGFSRRGFLAASSAAAAGLAVPRGAAAAEPNPSVAGALADLAPSGAPDEAYWWKVRGQFNLLDGMTFMNNGTLGPSPRVVLDTLERVAREVSEDPRNGYRFRDREAVRDRLAEFLSADPGEITLTRNTTEGMRVFAHGLDWREGDEVLMNPHEHPWPIQIYRALEKRRGIVIRWVEMPWPPESPEQILDLYRAAMTERTRALVVSHALYPTGLMMPATELCSLARERGILSSVDGAHPVGMVPVDLREMGCDHYAGAGQKWLLAGTGTGMAYVRSDLQDRIWPDCWVPEEDEGDYQKGARIYDYGGQRNAPSALAMGAAVELQQTVGQGNIETRIRELNDPLREALAETSGVTLYTPNDPRMSAGLTTFSIGEVPVKNIVDGVMERAGIFIRTVEKPDLAAVRSSVHFYNLPAEVDRLIEAVRHIAAHQADYL